MNCLRLSIAALLLLLSPVGGTEVRTAACFERRNNLVRVVVNFENDNPRPRDWIGVYFTDVDIAGTLPNRGDRWIRACGTRDCAVSRSTGRVIIETNLIIGNFKVVLARNNLNGIAESAAFEVSNDCEDAGATTATITTDQAVYDRGERIVVSFETNQPRQADFIAIFRDNIASNNLRGNGALWQWTCGGQAPNGCPNLMRDDNVIFSTNGLVSSWMQTHPLIGGNYFAYLLRNTGQLPFQVVARSISFRVLPQAANSVTPARMQNLRNDIENLINSDFPLAAKFLRLSFHDCVGGCDGCVDMRNPENAGLEVPIRALRSIVNQHSGFGFSRADVWMLAAIVGADISQPRQNRINFPFQFFGRVDCDSNAFCLDENGLSVPCTEMRGPHRHIPEADLTTRDFFRFFRQEFDFDTNEVVALMGAHTIGELARENSGVDGPNGWVLNNRVLDNEYYIELVGGNSIEDGLEAFIDGAPNWQRDFENNSDLNGIPSKHVWTGFPENTKIVMLNVDVAVVRSLNDSNMNANGQVSCNFIRENRCPHAEGALQQAARYRFDNRLWLEDFRAVCERMVNHGYSRPGCPNGQVCRLTPL